MATQPMATVNDVRSYYNHFSERFIKDYQYGNRRVERQLHFFGSAIPYNARNILVIGCGSGESAYHIATRVARSAEVIGVDLSDDALEVAQQLFAHPRIQYYQLDITAETLRDNWDVIVLPDVYEHIPLPSRPSLHRSLRRLLSPRGRILFSVPSPGHQAMLRAKGTGLQIIDEDVTLDDFSTIARDTDTILTYFNVVSVFNSNDYIHAMLERGAEQVERLADSPLVPIKCPINRGMTARLYGRLRRRSMRRWRGWRCRRLLRVTPTH